MADEDTLLKLCVVIVVDDGPEVEFNNDCLIGWRPEIAHAKTFFANNRQNLAIVACCSIIRSNHVIISRMAERQKRLQLIVGSTRDMPTKF